MKKGLILFAVFGLMIAFGIAAFFRSETIQTSVGKVINDYEVGDTVDSFNGVPVYYNGAVSHIGKRHLSESGYNYGLSYQCVEFVKRYYCDYLNHKMPNTYGNAKDFFDVKLKDGQLNKDRNLVQYNNGSKTLPQVNDLLVFGAVTFNKYGHVAIVSKADSTEIEMIQQNPGPTAPSRVTYKVEKKNGKWFIDRSDLLGWLRKE